MEIKKINEDQVEFVLTKADLSERDIEVVELSYGSEKKDRLLREMMERASCDCDFHADSDTTLVIEIMPSLQESLKIIVTRTHKYVNKGTQKNTLKIQKINDNQVKFIIDRTYLSEHNMKLADISHDSVKTQQLFAEMMEQAKLECGFTTDADTTLTIEAIPYSAERLTIIVKKNTKPIAIEPDTTYNEKI